MKTWVDRARERLRDHPALRSWEAKERAAEVAADLDRGVVAVHNLDNIGELRGLHVTIAQPVDPQPRQRPSRALRRAIRGWDLYGDGNFTHGIFTVRA